MFIIYVTAFDGYRNYEMLCEEIYQKEENAKKRVVELNNFLKEINDYNQFYDYKKIKIMD